MEDNLFERLTDLSIGTGSLTPIVAIQRIKELEGVMHKIAYWFDTDQEILDNMTAAERDDHIRQHKMVLDALFK